MTTFHTFKGPMGEHTIAAGSRLEAEREFVRGRLARHVRNCGEDMTGDDFEYIKKLVQEHLEMCEYRVLRS